MPTISFGKPDGSHILRPLFFDTRFEFVGQGTWDFENMPIPYTGLNFGDGTPNKYPDKLINGYIMSIFNINDRYTTAEKDSLDFGTRFGETFYDFAPDGNRKIFVVFTGSDRPNVTGEDNRLHTYNETVDPFDPQFTVSPVKPIINPNWEAGQRNAEAVTGIRGQFDIWISNIHVIDPTSFNTTYNVNDRLSVSKGRFKKAASGDVVKGRVKHKYTQGTLTKLLITVDTEGEYIIP